MGCHMNSDNEITAIKLHPMIPLVGTAASKTKASGETQDYSLWTLISIPVALNVQDWRQMLIGLIFSITAGASTPAQSLFSA